jgi:hypothetical protein
MRHYSLILTGEILPGADRAQAVAALAELLRLTLPQADEVLSGRLRQLQGAESFDHAVQVRERFERAGIVCEIREDAPAASDPPTAADAFRRPLAMGLESTDIRCPRCDEPQSPGETCRRCGIVFAKYEQRQRQAQDARQRATSQVGGSRFPYRAVQQLVLLVFLSSVALVLWSHWKKSQFPASSFYDLTQLSEPRQTPTDEPAFKIEAEGIQYTIEPLFDYELDGVVVSLHDSDVFWDIYHAKDWKDFINIRDLCVVWGDNVASGVFRKMNYSNSTWTCWISTDDSATAAQFGWAQLSNNHVLTSNPSLRRAIKSAEIGDQIHFEGKLAKYSHAGGFQRGTSTTRTDTGNGACETVYIERFNISRKSNTGWRLVYRLALGVAIAASIGLTMLFFVAPVRARR